MDEVRVYLCLHFASNKIIVANKISFFLIRSTFPPARDSLWPKSSGTFTQPLVALLSAVLLRRMNGVAT